VGGVVQLTAVRPGFRACRGLLPREADIRRTHGLAVGFRKRLHLIRSAAPGRHDDGQAAAPAGAKKPISASSTASGTSASSMWPQSSTVTVRLPAIDPASSRPALAGVMMSLAAMTTSAGQRTLAAASGPDFHALQASRSVASTPGALRANSAMVPPVIHRPG